MRALQKAYYSAFYLIPPALTAVKPVIHEQRIHLLVIFQLLKIIAPLAEVVYKKAFGFEPAIRLRS